MISNRLKFIVWTFLARMRLGQIKLAKNLMKIARWDNVDLCGALEQGPYHVLRAQIAKIAAFINIFRKFCSSILSQIWHGHSWQIDANLPYFTTTVLNMKLDKLLVNKILLFI